MVVNSASLKYVGGVAGAVSSGALWHVSKPSGSFAEL